MVTPRIAKEQSPSAASIVRAAEHAVQDDSVQAVTARWRAVLARDSADRAAALGLATIARQTLRLRDAPSAC